ncbi:MAG: LOG family protein [Chloroflexi bacterium]|nr:LOG family protein [Chloroflexota bacterium]
MTVGVMGSAGGKIPAAVLRRVFRLGQEIAGRGYVLITGACPGIPHEAVKGAKSKGGFVVGVSPALDFREHVEEFHSPTWGYDAIIYTGSGLMGREIENIRSCDVVILAGGRSGTLGEFAIAYDEAKIIGVLQGTGGITEHIPAVVSFVKKKTGAEIIYASDERELMDKLEMVYRQRLLPQYEAIIAAGSPHGVLED